MLLKRSRLTLFCFKCPTFVSLVLVYSKYNVPRLYLSIRPDILGLCLIVCSLPKSCTFCFSITDCLKEHNWLFRTAQCLGKGSCGEVIAVEHKVDGSKYAVKKLEKISQNNAEAEVEEAKRMCHILHANVCRYYNAWQENGFVYIRMELCDMDLASWLKSRNELLFENDQPHENIKPIILDSWVDLSKERNRRSPLRAEEPSKQTWFRSLKAQGTNDFLKGLLKGVRYLHDDQHLAHKDLHAKNVLLKINYTQNTVIAKICDFGSASTRKSESFSSSTDDRFCQDLESVGKIMTRMYYPLYGDAMDHLLSQLQKTSSNHERMLNPDFSKFWPDQASWIRRLLSTGSRKEEKPSAAEILNEGMRSTSESFPSEKYRKGREDGAGDQNVASDVQETRSQRSK